MFVRRCAGDVIDGKALAGGLEYVVADLATNGAQDFLDGIRLRLAINSLEGGDMLHQRHGSLSVEEERCGAWGFGGAGIALWKFPCRSSFVLASRASRRPAVFSMRAPLVDLMLCWNMEYSNRRNGANDTHERLRPEVHINSTGGRWMWGRVNPGGGGSAL